MVNATHVSFSADDRSYFSLIKKDIRKLAVEAGFEASRTNEIDIIVSELTSNLQKHTTGGGEILAGILGEGERTYLEIICIDNGPGIANTSKVVEDGYSTSNTLGHGFGSIKRLSDQFDIYSLKGWGTLVLCRIYKKPFVSLSRPGGVNLYPLVVAKTGEHDSGDGYYFQKVITGWKLLIADGLGHGTDANFAVNEAVAAFQNFSSDSAVEYIRFIHQKVKKTRGLVGNIILYNTAKNNFTVAGVGNISTRFFNALSYKNYISYNGIIGHNIPNTMNDVTHSQLDYNQFISCSDGVRSKWELQKFPSIGKVDCSLLTAAIYKEYGRRNDDTSVIVCKLMKV